MAAEGELTQDPVDDGEWVLFLTLVILVLYFAVIFAVAGVSVIL